MLTIIVALHVIRQILDCRKTKTIIATLIILMRPSNLNGLAEALLCRFHRLFDLMQLLLFGFGRAQVLRVRRSDLLPLRHGVLS